MAAGVAAPDIPQLKRLIGDRLESPTIALNGHSKPSHQEGHGIETTFKHERSWHAGIILEVPIQTQSSELKSCSAPKISPAPRTPSRAEFGHAIDETHATAPDCRGSRMGFCQFESGSKTGECLPLCEDFDGLRIELTCKVSSTTGGSSCGVGVISAVSVHKIPAESPSSSSVKNLLDPSEHST